MSRSPTEVNILVIGQTATREIFVMKYQLVKKDADGVLENFIRYKFIQLQMLRSKYKYSKNHGLLPVVASKPYRSPITSLALLGKNDQRTYQLHINPHNPNVFMLFNDRQYLHRQCTMVSSSENSNLMFQMLRRVPLKNKSLTVYVANDYKACDTNLIGDKESKNSLLWSIYHNMAQTKREKSKVMLSVFGIENQNELIDLLVIEKASDFNQYLPEYLKEETFQKRKILVNKNNKTGRLEPENGYRQQLTSDEDLKNALQRYSAIKYEMQTMKFSELHWNWFEGELFLVTEVEQNEEDGSFYRLKSHYILRVNQYLRSTSSLMLKLGMNVRKMQERYSNIICDNNESKLFKVLKQCFEKTTQTENYHIYLILEIGHYQTLKDQYQNLVPTSELLSTKFDPKTTPIENTSFLYLKHYHDHPKLVKILSQLISPKKSTEAKNIEEYLEEGEEKKPDKKSTQLKSYVYDTISSLQKRKIKSFIQWEEYGQEGPEADIEGFIRKTAKLYKQDETPKNRAESFSGVNRSTFKKSSNKTEQRMSLFQWGIQKSSRVPKVYASRRQKSQINEVERRSAECYSVESKNKRWKKYKTNEGFPRRGGQVDVQKFSSSKQEKTTKQIVDELVQREIMSMDRDDEIYSKDLMEQNKV